MPRARPLFSRSLNSKRLWYHARQLRTECSWTRTARRDPIQDESLGVSVRKASLSTQRIATAPRLSLTHVKYGQLVTNRYGSQIKTCWSSNKSLEKSMRDSQPEDQLDLSPPQYQLPTSGLISHLPRSWIPYAELVRLDKPTGTYYLLFPCLFSTLMAADYSATSLSAVASTSMLFAAGALIMRGAGCTINDLWDRNLDPLVNRTRLRPIARGAVTPINALIFTGFQLFAGLGILVQFPSSCLFYGIPSLLLVATYPLAKRVTHYPQIVLGLTFSWGAIMGFPALGIDLLADWTALKTAAALYASCVSWTVLYDMIYAHMDIVDDKKVGIKSIALRHASRTKVILTGLAFAQIGLLSAAGLAMSAGPVFFGSSCGLAATTLGLMIWKVRLREVSSCWWWFRYGAWFTGGGITAGLFGDYLVSHNRSKVERGSIATAGET